VLKPSEIHKSGRKSSHWRNWEC